MQVFYQKDTYLKYRSEITSNTRLGFVPTMGALHEGHASLARKSVSENDITVASIFVNPTQFGPTEDLDTYPRTLEKDVALLESIGVDVVFAPDKEQIYPTPPTQILFGIRDLDKKLCGASREGHFNGVVQVVSILFHIIQPHRAYFGLKDYQQFLIIKRMTEELHFPVEIHGCPTVREADGLAMSSRNAYLNEDERRQAVFLSATLNALRQQADSLSTVTQARDFVTEQLAKYPLARLDYFDILNGNSLDSIEAIGRELKPHAFMAAFLGKTRLIDNMPLYD